MTARLMLTEAGRGAMLDADNVGTEAVEFTEIAVGAGRAPDGADDSAIVAMRDRKLGAAPAGTVTAGRLAVQANLVPAENFDLVELAIMARIGAGAAFLFAYWNAGPLPAAPLARAVSGALLQVGGTVEVVSANAAIGAFSAGNIQFSLPPDASTTEKGIVKLATEDLADAGADDATAMTPALVKRRANAAIAAAGLDEVTFVDALPNDVSNGKFVIVATGAMGFVSGFDAGIALASGVSGPRGVAVKSNGDFVVADDSDGLYVYDVSEAVWAAPVAWPPGNKNFWGVAIDAAGDIHCADATFDKIHRYDVSAAAWAADTVDVPGNEHASGLAFDGDGDLMAMTAAGILRYDVSAAAWDSGVVVPEPPDTLTSGGLAIAPNGEIWSTIRRHGQPNVQSIARYDPVEATWDYLSIPYAPAKHLIDVAFTSANDLLLVSLSPVRARTAAMLPGLTAYYGDGGVWRRTSLL